MVIKILLLCLSTAYLFGYQITQETPKTKNLGYGDWFIHTDGELHFMEHWLRPNDVVFDVGANVGEWSLYALGVESSIALYSFEPVPLIFSDLQKKLSEYPNVQAINLALSDQTGSASFCYYDESYDFSSLSGFWTREVLKADHELPKIIEVEQDTVAHFCSERGIEKIDFLKIDAEGAEWIILKGAASLIENNQIQSIQFEYGGCYVDAKATLEEIYYFLKKHGYLIFRLMPDGLIEIKEWNRHLENFDLSNYVAIKTEAYFNRFMAGDGLKYLGPNH